MERPTWQHFAAGAVLIALTPWSLGCATRFYVRSESRAAVAEGSGALEVRVFETQSDLRRAPVASRGITTQLYRCDTRPETLIRHERATRWTVWQLTPGRYELRVFHYGRHATAGEDLRQAAKRLTIVAGQMAAATVILEGAHLAAKRAPIRPGLATAGTTAIGVRYLAMHDAPLGEDVRLTSQ